MSSDAGVTYPPFVCGTVPCIPQVTCKMLDEGFALSEWKCGVVGTWKYVWALRVSWTEQ